MNAPFFMNRALFGQSDLLQKEGGLSLLNSFMLTPDNYLISEDEKEPESMVVEEPKQSTLIEEPPNQSEYGIIKEPQNQSEYGIIKEPQNQSNYGIIKEPQNQSEYGIIRERRVPLSLSRHTPRERDSIFWCMYFAINGPHDAHNSTNLMMNEKKAMSDFFNKNPTSLKNINHRITLAKINEIKCDLMTKPFMTGVESFIPCAVYYKRPIFVFFEEIDSYFLFRDKTYVSDDENDDETILIYANGGRYSLETCKAKTSEFVRNKMSSCFFLHDCEKVMSGISAYNVEELKNYYKIVFKRRLEDEDPRFTKTQYHEKILLKCYSVVKNVINLNKS